MKIVTEYLLGDPSLWGAMNLFGAIDRYEHVYAVIQDNQHIKTYEDYYAAISHYFDGLWIKPTFIHESDFVEDNNDLEISVRLIYNTFNRKPIKTLDKQDMICYSFITKQNEQESENRALKKENVNTLLNYLDGYDLGDSRNNTPEQLIRKFDAIQKSELYIGSYCSWEVIAKSVFLTPVLYVYPKKHNNSPHKDGDGVYDYFEKKWYKYGRA